MSNTNSVTKITIPHPFIMGRSNASKEINHAKLMGEKNIGPKVHRTKKTLFKSSMNMNYMNGSLWNVTGNKIELTKGDMKKIIKLVLKMHKEGYYHGRISQRTVMWKELEDGKNFKLVGFKKMGKIEDKLDYKHVLWKIKTIHKDDWVYDMKDNIIIVGSHEEDIRDLFELLASISNIYRYRRNNNERDTDSYYNEMKYNEHMYKFSKWFRETVEAEVKNLNNKNKKRNNNKTNNRNNNKTNNRNNNKN